MSLSNNHHFSGDVILVKARQLNGWKKEELYCFVEKMTESGVVGARLFACAQSYVDLTISGMV